MNEEMVKTVIKAAGTGMALANKLGISHQAIYQWKSIPPKHVLALEKITGIPRYVLRPDYYPREDAA